MPNISGISAENKVRLDDNIKKVNSELDKYKQEEISRCGLQKEVAEAMWYTLSATSFIRSASSCMVIFG